MSRLLVPFHSVVAGRNFRVVHYNACQLTSAGLEVCDFHGANQPPRACCIGICDARRVCAQAAPVHAQTLATPSQPSNPIATRSPQAAASSPVLSLTLTQAVHLALKQNPQRVIAQILLSESERNKQIARSPLLPQASIEGNAALSQYNVQIVESLPHRTPAGPYQFLNVGPNYSLTLLDLPLIRDYQIGKEGVKQARWDEKTTREIVVLTVVNQYLLILRAIANRDAAQSRVALAQRLYDQAAQLQKTESASTSTPSAPTWSCKTRSKP